MLTIQDMFQNQSKIDEGVLVEVSDQLWKLGSLQEIKEKVSEDLFVVHVGINMIGNWKNDGWWCLICEQAYLVPYIPDVLKIFGLEEMKTVFESIISLFPEYTTFSNEDESYYDIVNFLQNAHFKVNDERLNHISIEKRKAMVRLIHQRLDRLEDITDPLWGYGSQNDGWKSVLDFIALKI
ncbi:hypothetical protein [Longibaculum muris]|uniref:hypothetical protein n=1 Tax=Longibaculum muris TaxID=1796628 RepID=UPI00189DA40A|nr:hypothetical protein [Longibaculum muris]